MKLQQLHEDMQTLEEGIIQRAIAAATLALSSLGQPSSTNTADIPSPPKASAAAVRAIDQISSQTANVDRITANMPSVVADIAQRYRVDPQMVERIVKAAIKHQRPDFPRAADILAVVAVESSFNPNAKSNLKYDPARGLTQVRPKIWNIPKESLNSIEGQIEAGAKILHQYYQKLGNREAALHAYNVGITNHKRSLRDPSKGNPRYVPKVNKEWDRYANYDPANQKGDS